MAGLAEGVVDFALHCIALHGMTWHGMDGIPGFGFQCGVIERGLERFLEEKGLVDNRLNKKWTKAYAKIFVS